MLATGYWLLATGYWLLATDHWLYWLYLDMIKTRSFLTSLLAILFTIPSSVIIVIACLILFPYRFSVGKKLTWLYSYVILKIYRVNITRKTPINIPDNHNGIILISNHVSFLDIPLLIYLYQPYFVCKESIKYWPFMGTAIWLTGHIFLNRNSMSARLSLIHLIAAKISKNTIFTIFPQGTTGKITDKKPFHRGIFKVIELNPNIRFLPVTLHYIDDVKVAWGKETLLTNVLSVGKLPRINVEVTTHNFVTLNKTQYNDTGAMATQMQEVVFSPLFT